MLGGPYVTSMKTATPDVSSPSPRSRARGRSVDDADSVVPSVSGGGYKDGVLTDVPLRDSPLGPSVNKKTDGDYCIDSSHVIRGRHDDCRVSRRQALASLVLFMMLGGAIATAVIVIKKPGCFGGSINDGVEANSSSSLQPGTGSGGDSSSNGGDSNSIPTDKETAIGVPVLPPEDTEAPTSSPSTSAPTAEAEPLPPAEPGFPESCSVEKLREIRKQLPAYSCYPPPSIPGVKNASFLMSARTVRATYCEGNSMPISIRRPWVATHFWASL